MTEGRSSPISVLTCIKPRAILHEGERGCQIQRRREKKMAARTNRARAACVCSFAVGPVLLLVVGYLELGRGRERLARNSVADADGDVVVAGRERGGWGRAGEWTAR